MSKQSKPSQPKSKPGKEEPAKKGIPNYMKFINGGIAGCGAVTFCQPIDVVKNRMQLSGEGGKERAHRSSLHAVRDIVKNEGGIALYDGFSANIARQLCYTMTRLGVFQISLDKFEEMGFNGLGPQVTSGLIAGGIASAIATPTDVALVRMTADRRLPSSEQRNYKHVFNAVTRISNEEGVRALWTGVGPTVLRAMLGNVTQMVSYVQAKQYFLHNGRMKDDFSCHFVSSIISGFVYAVSTIPLDVAKTRVQTMKVVDGVPEYSGLFDVWSKILKSEGPTGFYKGFGPYYFRIAPFTVLMFVFMEQLTKMYKIYVLNDPDAKGGF